MKEAGVTGRLSIDFMIGNNPETRARWPRSCSR